MRAERSSCGAFLRYSKNFSCYAGEERTLRYKQGLLYWQRSQPYCKRLQAVIRKLQIWQETGRQIQEKRVR